MSFRKNGHNMFWIELSFVFLNTFIEIEFSYISPIQKCNNSMVLVNIFLNCGKITENIKTYPLKIGNINIEYVF